MNEIPCRRSNVFQAAGKQNCRAGEHKKARGCQIRSSEPELKMRPTRSALPWVPPLVPLNRHANAAAILRCQTRRSRADQSIRFVSAESSQPETHSRANKQLASGQIHDEARTIQSIPPPTKKTPRKLEKNPGN